MERVVPVPAPECLNGKMKSRWNLNHRNIQGRFNPKLVLAYALHQGIERMNSIDLEKIHHADPDFPADAICMKCKEEVAEATVSLIILEDGSLLERNGVPVERGNARVVKIPDLWGRPKYIPMLFCETCRWTKEISFVHFDDIKGTASKITIPLGDEIPCKSYKEASAQAKKLNSRFARKPEKFILLPKTEAA